MLVKRTRKPSQPRGTGKTQYACFICEQVVFRYASAVTGRVFCSNACVGQRDQRDLLERLQSWIDVRGPDECWPWMSGSARNGYGNLTFKGKTLVATRALWGCVVGPIKPGHDICHTCDNPPCMNIKHLFEGTRRVNADDMTAKKRHTWKAGPGSFKAGFDARRGVGGSSGSKLTERQVWAIRVLATKGLTITRLAEIYQKSTAAISAVVHRKTYA